MKRRLLVQLTALVALSFVGAKFLSDAANTPAIAQSAVKEINFGIISTESQANQRPLWEPFIAAMSKSIGIPVKPFYVTQYSGVIEGMRFGKVQVAWYGGKSYVEAARIANAQVFAQVVNADGTKGYYSYLIMNKANPLTRQAKAMGGEKFVIKNASKLTFAFNEPNSTSGYLVPSYYIFAKNDVDPKKSFKRLVFSGNHEATALAVANGQVDVATNNSEALDRLEKTNPEARKKLEIIWVSPVIPSDPIAYRKDLPEDVKAKLRNFFLTYKDKNVLEPFKWSGFAPAQDSIWDPIRELELAKQILEIKNKDSLSAADQQKLSELKSQLQALKKK